MKKILNLKIKYREDYRPFAPSILEEDLKEYFNLSEELEYMTFTLKVNNSLKKRYLKQFISIIHLEFI